MALSTLSIAGCTPDTNSGTDIDEGALAEASHAANGALSGAQLFKKETFGGNGRTCGTCHLPSTGTISPKDIQSRFAKDPKDPLFRPLDSDDGTGSSYTRLLKHATFLIPLTLPLNVKLADDPKATEVVLERGSLSVLDTPALDPVLMWDGRAPNLKAQAFGAVITHAEPKRLPTIQELTRIADFEKGLFSSAELEVYAKGGPAPGLPAGETAAEKRGREFFAPNGLCGQCHSGVLLNEVSSFGNVLGQPPGARFSNVRVSDPAFNPRGRPGRKWIVTLPDGSKVERISSDPGRFLATGNIADFDQFKITSLRNIKHTAPYFHDNSAKTLEEMTAHYARIFAEDGITLTKQDQADIIAFLKLL
ncbi:cytochrome-c peroxidase [Polyangium aurulentum]|uniref:cytochrome-c peroxidase n=1 Tax=Polyangium aurulentum TaxID=2567896 RepID=UPI00146E572E|nr:cytochrome c peroxidase [Polyangium aurulentum]UQA56641.1 hypothetical protein E8A73_035840 [Polyangium aurulentum]